MRLRRRIPRGLVALAMAVVLAALAVGMPLLDIGQLEDVVVVNDGDVPEGAGHHDHAACMLYGSAPWSPVAATEPPAASPVLRQSPPTEHTRVLDRGRASLTRSRAPPSA